LALHFGHRAFYVVRESAAVFIAVGFVLFAVLHFFGEEDAIQLFQLTTIVATGRIPARFSRATVLREQYKPQKKGHQQSNDSDDYVLFPVALLDAQDHKCSSDKRCDNQAT
jgi:hypothetical protein